MTRNILVGKIGKTVKFTNNKIETGGGNDVLLIPMNKDYQTRRLPASRVKVQGILSGLMRTYH